MKFTYTQGNADIEIDFYANETSVRELFDGGYLNDDEFDVEDFLLSNTYDDILADAVIDWIHDRSEAKIDENSDEEFLQEENDVARAMYVIDENTYFAQFLEWKWA